MTEDFARVWRAYEQAPHRSGMDKELVVNHLRRTLVREVDAATGPQPTPRAIADRLSHLNWDLILSAAEFMVWLLPSAGRPEALRVLGRARALLPMPAWDDPDGAAATRLCAMLVKSPSVEAEEAFLAAVRRVRSENQWSLILDAASFLTGPRRDQALREALDSAFGVPDEIHVGQAVAAVVLRDPDALLEPALVRAEALWGEKDSRWSFLVDLAPKIDREHAGPVFDHAASLSGEYERASIFGAFGARLPLSLRTRRDAIAATFEDQSVMASMLPAPRPPPLAPGDLPTLYDAIQNWSGVARELDGTPVAHDIANGVFAFLEETTRLYAAADLASDS